jgi:hypothetical protein
MRPCPTRSLGRRGVPCWSAILAAALAAGCCNGRARPRREPPPAVHPAAAPAAPADAPATLFSLADVVAAGDAARGQVLELEVRPGKPVGRALTVYPCTAGTAIRSVDVFFHENQLDLVRGLYGPEDDAGVARCARLRARIGASAPTSWGMTRQPDGTMKHTESPDRYLTARLLALPGGTPRPAAPAAAGAAYGSLLDVQLDDDRAAGKVAALRLRLRRIEYTPLLGGAPRMIYTGYPCTRADGDDGIDLTVPADLTAAVAAAQGCRDVRVRIARRPIAASTKGELLEVR